jgi:hypothetical protein
MFHRDPLSSRLLPHALTLISFPPPPCQCSSPSLLHHINAPYQCQIAAVDHWWFMSFFEMPESDRISFLTSMTKREKLMYFSLVAARADDPILKEQREQAQVRLRVLHSHTFSYTHTPFHTLTHPFIHS